MAKKKRVAVDVDGVVLDLMGGWARWLYSTKGIVLDPRSITRHNLREEQYVLDRFGGSSSAAGASLVEFLKVPDVYHAWCVPIMNAVHALEEISKTNDVCFVTAILDEAPESYVSKRAELKRLLPRIRMATFPSSMKDWVAPDVAIDDRWDTCERWAREQGCVALNFRQPWSEAPADATQFDWNEILESGHV